MTINRFTAMFAAGACLVAPQMSARFDACLSMLSADADVAKLLHPSSQSAPAAAANDADFWFASDDWRAAYRPYVVVEGVLQIPVKGVLLHNFPFSIGDWATGYEYIWRAFKRGMEDSSVSKIALVIDSPGGMVAGCGDAADQMYAIRDQKPVEAFAHEGAYSAAYWIASVAPKLTVSRTGGVGSVGVVTSHTDASGALEQRGLKITFIFAGAHKVDGNATEPLPDDVKANMQARIDELYGVFVSTVARNRGMEEAVVRGSEAACFTATQAVSNGFADAVGSLDDAMSAFTAGDLSNNGEEAMSTTTDTSAADHAAAIEAAVASANAASATAQSAAVAEAVANERTRIGAILGSDEAKGRTALATHIAMSTDMSLDAAKEMLGKSSVATSFGKTMDAAEHPESGAETLENREEASADGSDVLALVQGAGMRGFRPAAK